MSKLAHSAGRWSAAVKHLWLWSLQALQPCNQVSSTTNATGWTNTNYQVGRLALDVTHLFIFFSIDHIDKFSKLYPPNQSTHLVSSPKKTNECRTWSFWRVARKWQNHILRECSTASYVHLTWNCHIVLYIYILYVWPDARNLLQSQLWSTLLRQEVSSAMVGYTLFCSQQVLHWTSWAMSKEPCGLASLACCCDTVTIHLADALQTFLRSIVQVTAMLIQWMTIKFVVTNKSQSYPVFTVTVSALYPCSSVSSWSFSPIPKRQWPQRRPLARRSWSWSQ